MQDFSALPSIRRRPGREGWWARVKAAGARRSDLKKFATDAQGRDYAVVQLSRWLQTQDLIARGVTTVQELDAAQARNRPILGGGGALEAWMASPKMQRNTPSHRRMSRQWVERFARDAHARTLGEVTKERVAGWQDGLAAQGLAPQSIRQARTRLGTLLRFCRARGWIDAVVTQDVPLDAGYDELRQAPGALTVPQYRALLDRTPDPWRALRYAFGGSAGLRVHEVERLRWEYLDLDGGWLHLPAKATKSKRDAELPLAPDLVARAAALRPLTTYGPVFERPMGRYRWLKDLIAAEIIAVRWTGPPRLSKRGKPMTPNLQQDRHELIGYRDDRGRVLNRRCLRRTFGTHLAIAKVDISAAAKLMRHTDPRLTLELYTDGRLLDLAGAAARLGDLRAASDGLQEDRTA